MAESNLRSNPIASHTKETVSARWGLPPSTKIPPPPTSDTDNFLASLTYAFMKGNTSGKATIAITTALPPPGLAPKFPTTTRAAPSEVSASSPG